MNKESLDLIEEVSTNFSKVSFIEIAQDSIYVELMDVELGIPKTDVNSTLSIRLAENSFISVFYDDIWDVDFLSNFDYKNHFLRSQVMFNVTWIKFMDFQYLNKLFYSYSNKKEFTQNKSSDIHNVDCDFFVLIKCGKIAIVAGGNEMDFFTDSEKLDESSLKELSNQWIKYYLDYHQKLNIIKDPMCENHPFNR